jgi:RNA polymerase sigma factor (sigma-70 family)
VTTTSAVEDLLRELAPRVLSTIVRRFGQFDRCEDAVQEALLAAAIQWPESGVPESAHGWLVTVASRRMADQLRSESARQRREATAAASILPVARFAPAADEQRGDPSEDTLTLLFLCCHPALSPASQIALTLRAVGGLTTTQIAQAFFVPEATMAQRISRAKASIKAAGATFNMPPPAERADRLRAVLHVLYLVFNEGYTATSGAELHRPVLSAEALRLTGDLHRLLPDDGEVAGLFALMLLTDARRPARTTDDGELVPLAEQDRRKWDRASIAQGLALVSDTLSRAPVGPYQLQAAIAAVHDEAASSKDTDWTQILALYEMLAAIAPNPMVMLNQAVALAMVRGPDAGLELMADIETDGRLARSHRVDAVRAHLLEMAGETAAAEKAYRAAARRTNSRPEQRYLERRANQLTA